MSDMPFTSTTLRHILDIDWQDVNITGDSNKRRITSSSSFSALNLKLEGQAKNIML